MRGFVYTLIAVIFSLIAISIFLLSQNYFEEDSYQIMVLKDRLGYNVLAIDNLNINYSDGIMIREILPHPNLTIGLYKLSLFYQDFSEYNITFGKQNFLDLYGVINYSQPANNETIISFNSSFVKIDIYCNCSEINYTIENSTTYYYIRVYNGSGEIYDLEGDYSGVIKSSDFILNFNQSKFYVSGDLIGEYLINCSRGILLSNLNYTINYRDNEINSIVKVRV